MTDYQSLDARIKRAFDVLGAWETQPGTDRYIQNTCIGIIQELSDENKKLKYELSHGRISELEGDLASVNMKIEEMRGQVGFRQGTCWHIDPNCQRNFIEDLTFQEAGNLGYTTCRKCSFGFVSKFILKNARSVELNKEMAELQESRVSSDKKPD